MLDYIFKDFIEPAMRPTRSLIAQLADQGVLRALPDREILMLLSGAIGVFSLRALSDQFNKIDGLLNEEEYCDEMVRVIINGMRIQLDH